MLAGIKTGKKKRKAEPSSANASVADQLRQSLLAGGSSLTKAVPAKRDDGEPASSPQEERVIVTTTAPFKNEQDLSIQELAAQERATSGNMSLAEQEARNVLRLNKKRRVKLKTLARADSDDDLERQMRHATADMTSEKAQKRQTHRLVHLHDKQEQITAKCWWWMESSSFARHRLLALGDACSLVMAPPNQSLVVGHHFYIVPIPHAESLTACDETVWEEIRNFQNSLRALFAKEKMGVLFYETVLPNKGFWQTKLEAVAVPQRYYEDAPLFFKSALSDVAEEHGTHQRILKTTATKPLRNTIPPNFPYLYIEYDANQGFVQMIESASIKKDFVVDTIASMMQMEPMRFKKQQAQHDERQLVLSFLDKYKAFDWTLQLEDDGDDDK